MGSGEQSKATAPLPKLRPPGATSAPNRDATAGRRGLWIALTVTLGLSLMVTFLLPQWISAPDAPSAEVSPDVQVAPPPVAAPDTTARAQAEQALQQWLQLRAKLELANAPVWGGAEWEQATEQAATGDRLFGQRQFSEAAQAYTQAQRNLESLYDSREQRLAAALETGQGALQNDNVEAAQQQFELALAIEPENAQAQRGLARAGVRPEVMRLTQAGAVAENAGDLEAARTAYLQATALDGEYSAGRAGLARVSQQLREQAFAAAMSRSLAALDAGRFDEADQALKDAAQLQPEAAAVHDTRRRLVRARQQLKLNQLRKEASVKVENEDWQAASALYQAALVVDPQAGFARDGLKRAQDRIRLHRQLDHYLADPHRLYSPEPLANAERLLSVAGTPPANEPRLVEKVVTLKRHVSEAHTPLPVTLHSDGNTDVVIYHVGRLGRFRDHTLQLRPGTYTAVGTRPGYRDVRKVFQVQPGTPLTALQIRCEERV